MIEEYLKMKHATCIANSPDALAEALPGEKVRCVILNVEINPGIQAHVILFESGCSLLLYRCSLLLFGFGSYEIVDAHHTKRILSNELQRLKSAAKTYALLKELLGGE